MELQASLHQQGRYVARRCIVLLACAVDGGAVVPSPIVERCREVAERCGDAAVRTLFLACLRRLAGHHDKAGEGGATEVAMTEGAGVIVWPSR